MTIKEAIDLADLARANEVEPELKLMWLSSLDGQIYQEILRRHWFLPDELDKLGFQGYDSETDINNTRMLVEPPYDELYVNYLMMRIDLYNNDLDLYNNDTAVFDRSYLAWTNWHNVNHRPFGLRALRF